MHSGVTSRARGGVRAGWVGLVALAGISAACNGPGDRNVTPRVWRPSCTLPICTAPCLCDTDTACTEACSCDPECGQCRVAEASCTTPRDAGLGDTGSVTPQDGGGTGDGAPFDFGVGDAGPCTFPSSQGRSMPCCLQLGVDACGAGLFCAAFDGRTQPTCYAEEERLPGQSCFEDRHCSNRSCNLVAGACRFEPQESWTANVGCRSASGLRYECDPVDGRCGLVTGATGSLCLEPGDCDSGTCVDHRCAAPPPECTDGNDCPLTDFCVANQCTCNAVDARGCGPTENCVLTGVVPNLSFTCAAEGPAQEGASCSGPGDCARGTQCLAVGGSPTCQRFCDPAAPTCPNCQPIQLQGLPVTLGLCGG